MLYVIHDDVATVICNDYHVIKALARTLVGVTDRPIPIRYGDQVIKTMGVDDATLIVPLHRLRPIVR